MNATLQRWAAHLGVEDQEDAVSVLRSLVARLEDAQAEIAYVRGMLIGDPRVHVGTAAAALDQAVDALSELARRFHCNERRPR